MHAVSTQKYVQGAAPSQRLPRHFARFPPPGPLLLVERLTVPGKRPRDLTVVEVPPICSLLTLAFNHNLNSHTSISPTLYFNMCLISAQLLLLTVYVNYSLVLAE